LIFSLILLPGLIFGQSTKKIPGSESKAGQKQSFSVADGYLTFDATTDWKKVQPKIDFIHAEFSIPKAEGDDSDGRITFSQVGGTIDDNLNRWVEQFKDADATDKEQVIRKSETVDGKNVQLIIIHGTFVDGGGRPMGPKTERENYTMMGAAIEVEGGNNVYIKAYGPKKTMEASHDALREMLMSMKTSDG
jgi:hypothetical protein